MMLWMYWWQALWMLRSGCSRLSTFLWFSTCVVGLSIRSERLGVTSIVRAIGLEAGFYRHLLHNFHSQGIKLDKMTALWTQTVVRLFPRKVEVNGRLVLVGDGIKIGKQGKKMPAVKLLHQSSESNTKPTYIMGHSFQAISMLVEAANGVVAVPLAKRIHEGIVSSNRDKRTLLDKMIALLRIVPLYQGYYFVADAYYASRKMVNGLLNSGNHLITRCKSNSVAYFPYQHRGPNKRGRPRVYGNKVALRSLFQSKAKFQSAPSPVYGETNTCIDYRVCDLLWRPVGLIVRFVLVVHPTRGRCILMSTDTTLDALLLDEHHETSETSKRQSAPTSRVEKIPQCRSAKNGRIPRLRLRRHRLPRSSSIPQCRLSTTGLALFRLLAQDHSTWCCPF